MIKLTPHDEYPTLKLLVQQSGYTYKTANDFTATDLRGAPARINADIQNGWYSGKIKLLIKNSFEAQYWDAFYKAKFDGKNGGIQRVMPFYFQGIVDGITGLHLCQIVKSSYSHSNFKWQTQSITLDVQIRPAEPAECFDYSDVIEMYNCGYKQNDDKRLAEITDSGFDPINR